jgi:hypothetical protein
VGQRLGAVLGELPVGLLDGLGKHATADVRCALPVACSGAKDKRCGRRV